MQRHDRLRRRRRQQVGAAAGLLAASLVVGLSLGLPAGVGPPATRTASPASSQGGLTELGAQPPSANGRFASGAAVSSTGACPAGIPGCPTDFAPSAKTAARSLPVPRVRGGRLEAVVSLAPSGSTFRLRALGWSPRGAASCVVGRDLVVSWWAPGREGRQLGELVVPAGAANGRPIETVATGLLGEGAGGAVVVVVRTGSQVRAVRATFDSGAGALEREGRPTLGWVVLAVPASARVRGPVEVSALGRGGTVVGRQVVPGIGMLEGTPVRCAPG